MSSLSELPGVQPEDMDKMHRWAGEWLSDPTRLPISFRYGEKAVSGIPASWHPSVEKRRMDANLREVIFTGTEPSSGLTLRVECLWYADFPVVEWVVWLTNQGDRPTPILSDILALDGSMAGPAPILYHCNGDFYSASGYTPTETPVEAGETLAYNPRTGRSCDEAFPYYRILFPDGGFNLAIGWPAQWSARFSGTEGGIRIQVGQEKTHLSLLPGECIRTPRITLLAWAGSSARAANLWRRWYLAHILPHPKGQPLPPHLAVCGTDEGEEFTAATEHNQARYIQKFKQIGLPFDVWWIDAGWYPCYNPQGERRWPVTGTWKPDPERFPRGLKPVSEAATRHGADLLVWFEPERVRVGTQLDLEHPEWLLRAQEDEQNHMLFLGNPEARRWLTDHVCTLIQENGIKIYRQDFNYEPIQYWRANDAPDRQGMNENLHVQGYLRFWDDLLERNPGLWIDSCASGGRRNDLETMRRSVPLHYSDYGYGDHPIKLSFHHTLFDWIPYFKDVTVSWDETGNVRFDDKVDSFSFHCGLAPMLFVSVDVRREDYDYPLAVRLAGIWQKVAPLMLYGDYYPLTPFHKSAEQWVAWQFDRPESGSGFIQAIRLQKCPQETFTARLKGLLPEADYWLENPESGQTLESSGKTLMENGLPFTLEQRSGSLWLYRLKT